MSGDKVKASAIFAEAFRLEGEVKRLTKERDEARTALEAMKDRDYEPIKKWIQNDAPEAVRKAYAIMAKAEAERDLARAEVQAWKDGVCQDCVDLRADVKRLREALEKIRGWSVPGSIAENTATAALCTGGRDGNV